MICFWDFLWLNLAYWFETFVNLPNYIPHCDAVIPKGQVKIPKFGKNNQKSKSCTTDIQGSIEKFVHDVSFAVFF